MTESLERGTYLQQRYCVEKVLGKGGFGITYLVSDEKTGQHVVVKEYFPMHLVMREKGVKEISVMDPDKEKDYQIGMEKFLAEARTMSSLASVPEIVKVLNYFQENHGAYLVMEYVQGTSLCKYLERMDELPSFETVREMLLPVIRALGAVHKKGMIHRDLTPDNLLVKEDGNIKIIDFGSAREYVEDEKTKTVLVKSGYAPLEQYSKKEKQGPWTDVYALCATMYEMLTGAVPQDALKRMEDDELYAPSLYGAEISPEEEAVLMKGLALDYRNRYASMKELESALFPQKEAEIQEKRKKSRVGIAVASVIVIAAAVLIGLTMGKTEEIYTAAYAGNYERDSVEYHDYLDFLKENAVSEEDMEDGIRYTLEEDVVLEWGLPCNLWRFLKTSDEFFAYLEERGYTAAFKENRSEVYAANVGKYSAVTTEFYRTDVYQINDNMLLQVRIDAVNGDVLRVSVLESEAPSEDNALLAAEIVGCFSEHEPDHEENAEVFEKTLEELESAEGTRMSIYTLPDLDMMYSAVDENANADYLIVPCGVFTFTSGTSLCYWP